MPTWDELATRQAQSHDNPLIVRYGPGPAGARCRDCCHRWRMGHNSKTYGKCNLRPLTHGAGSDHPGKWPACKRFVAVPTTGRGRIVGYRSVNRQGGSTIFCLACCQPHRPDRALAISMHEASTERCLCSLCQKPLEVSSWT